MPHELMSPSALIVRGRLGRWAVCFFTSRAFVRQDGMVDTRPKKCEISGCKYAANYGDTLERTRRFCARHKLDGMFSYQDLVRLGDTRVLYPPRRLMIWLTKGSCWIRKTLRAGNNKTALLPMYKM